MNFSQSVRAAITKHEQVSTQSELSMHSPEFWAFGVVNWEIEEGGGGAEVAAQFPTVDVECRQICSVTRRRTSFPRKLHPHPPNRPYYMCSSIPVHVHVQSRGDRHVVNYIAPHLKGSSLCLSLFLRWVHSSRRPTHLSVNKAYISFAFCL